MRYRFKAYHVVLALGFIGCFVAFSPVLTTPFRSDEWYIASFARNAPVTLETISQASSWELFGDPRFQPFSHLLLFLIHKVFGNAFVLFHLLSWVSHVTVGLLIYAIVKELHSDKMTAALCAILFVTGFSHFDTVSWTYHIYIIHQTICLLFGFWVALRDPSQLRWWQALIGGILVGFASYFYEAGLAIPVLILVAMSCSKYETRKSGLGSNSRSILPFVVCLVVGYVAFLGFHLQRVGSQISAQIDTSSVITGGHNTLKGLWTQGVVGNLGFPPRYSFGDLFYLQGSEFEFLPIFAIVFFLIAVMRNLGPAAQKSLPRTENRKYLLLIFLACAVSYYGIIAIGRFNLYVVTQARYFYLPDAFLVLAFSWPMAAAGSLKLQNHSKDSAGPLRRVRGIVMRPQTWAMCAVCVVIILNSYHIFGSCREIAQIVSPVRDSIEAVKDFSRTSKGTKRLYVDFVPRSMGERLFGGSHIALETCFSNTGILTRQVAKAEYTLGVLRWSLIM
ncbi:MAG: glycosyltransferase family 39 protein [Deltaproteobacteria bacterium]|nr:glycosyltransferase family 39 protein [Deltaproteobacteria bacterium]